MEFDAKVNALSEQSMKIAIILTTSAAKLKLRINTKTYHYLIENFPLWSRLDKVKKKSTVLNKLQF